MMEMKCDKCNCRAFNIEIKNECDECEHNRWWDEDKEGDNWQPLPPPDDIENVYYKTDDDGECEMGTSFNAGCYLFKCTTCGNVTHCPTFRE